MFRMQSVQCEIFGGAANRARRGVRTTLDALRPLLEAALDNALAQGDSALTGPIVRGDVNTVRAHLAEIAANQQREQGGQVEEGVPLTESERARTECVILPLFPHMSSADVARVASTLRDACAAGHA